MTKVEELTLEEFAEKIIGVNLKRDTEEKKEETSEKPSGNNKNDDPVLSKP